MLMKHWFAASLMLLPRSDGCLRWSTDGSASRYVAGLGRSIRQLRQRDCSIWIYTSSGRTAFRIRLWLLLHGIRIDGVVNEERHRRELARYRFSRLPSKYPPAFGIDLHVDDSEGVQMEGEEHGFRVVVVHPDDENWTERVLDAVIHTHAD